MKTGIEIIDAIFEIFKVPLLIEISGQVYKGYERPLNAKTEDAVFEFSGGVDSTIQEGDVNINVYIPDIDNGDNIKVCDVARCAEIENLLSMTVESNRVVTDYYISTNRTIQTYKLEGIEQHFVNCKVHYKRLNY